MIQFLILFKDQALKMYLHILINKNLNFLLYLNVIKIENLH